MIYQGKMLKEDAKDLASFGGAYTHGGIVWCRVLKTKRLGR